MLILEYISQLIADALSATDCLVYVSVGMSVYPKVYRTVGYVVAEFYREGSVDTAVLELRCHQLERGYMMGCYDYLGGLGLCYGFLYKGAALLVFLVESLCR